MCNWNSSDICNDRLRRESSKDLLFLYVLFLEVSSVLLI